jgi:hypothetical protein
MKKEADARKHELNIMNMQMQAQAQGHNNRLEEIREGTVVEELRAWRDQIKGIYDVEKTPTGIAWIDGFNRLIRPTTAASLMILFNIIAYAYVFDIINNGNGLNAVTATLIWGSLVGEAIQAVLGYLFGYRTTRKMLKR